MDANAFDQELEKRLQMIESPDGPPLAVADLPLRDVVIAVVALVAVCCALMWWAY